MAESSEGRSRDRSELGFVEEAQAAFGFLLSEFGFRLARSESPTLVRYESPAMFLNVYHGRQSYELNVEVGSLSDPMGRSYGLPDVLGAIVDPDDGSQTYFQASNREAVRRCIQDIADLVAKHYGSVLRGDAGVLDRVEEHRSEHARSLTSEIVQRPIRAAAEEAWRIKDYAKVQELYVSIFDDLSPVEQKRLEYAARHSRLRK